MRLLTPAEVKVARKHLSTRTMPGDDGCILWTIWSAVFRRRWCVA